MKPRPAVIVLAAGRGSRFHGMQHKLTQVIGTSTVLATTLVNALAAEMPVLVVTTEPLAELASHHVATRDIVLLPAAGSEASLGLGMGYSIAAGVAARSNASGWLILPADMPLVQPATLRSVARLLDHHPVAYAQHHGKRGHPVGFSAELYSELVRLTGDEGARRLIARYPCKEIEVDDPGVLLDIDTHEDLSHVRATYAMSPFRNSV
ncbi:molybdopterin-guanine dinucleotide biosynthesis protein MobA [Rhizobacter sp. Root1221]|nr:nucleotidyltransferase family protein [Rhizobacter sp. Root1221]KQV82967.1 molybdopterin-guanine dinucleotide biosynthesis protein MobA [Rhizobacter sp. Root1221]